MYQYQWMEMKLMSTLIRTIINVLNVFTLAMITTSVTLAQEVVYRRTINVGYLNNHGCAESGGFVYSIDYNGGRITKHSSDGALVDTWSGVNGAHTICVDRDGTLLVADTGNHRIVRFSPSGDVVQVIGQLGNADGQLNLPHDVCVDVDGSILVADTGNNRVVRFSSEGAFISTFGTYGSGSSDFNSPQGIAVSRNGRIFVADCINGRLKIYTPSGSLSAQSPPMGTLIRGVRIDAVGNAHVTEMDNRRITVWSPDALFAYTYGSAGTGDYQFLEPRTVSISATGLIYVVDKSAGAIKVFELANSAPKTTGRYVLSDSYATTDTNPSGVFTFGGKSTRVGSFTQASFDGLLFSNAKWVTPFNQLEAPYIWKNGTGSVQNGIADSQVSLHPDQSASATIRFTAPHDGTYTFSGQFTSGDTGDMQASIVRGSVVVKDFQSTESSPNFDVTLVMKAGESLDFQVEPSLLGSTVAGDTGLSLNVTSNFIFRNRLTGQSYQLFLENGISWDQSRDRSSSLMFDNSKGHLATLTSKEENDWVMTSLGAVAIRNVALGGYQLPNQATTTAGWQWITGERWTFTNWNAYPEPNDGGSWVETNNENALVFAGITADGTWNDSSLTAGVLWGYIVEFDGPDVTPPSSSLSLHPDPANLTWINLSTNITIVADDISGIATIHYTIDSGAEQVVAGDTVTFTVSDSGIHNIAYWAVDNAGNIEVTKYATVRIDTIAPVTTLTRAGGNITLSATDTQSGVAKTRFAINGGAAQDYSLPISDAIHKITYWSEDVAGNVEASRTEQLNPGVQAVLASAPRLVGGVGVIGTVTLDQPAPAGGTTVTLSASNTAVAVPASIIIPEGQTTGEFDIDASPVALATSAVITASCFGTEQSTIITIDAPTPHSVTLAQASITGGSATSATVLISGLAPAGGLQVRLASSSLAMSVPSTVTIPAGQMSASINIQTNVISVDSTAVLSATANGVRARSTLAILGPRIQTLSLSPTTIASGGTIAGTVTLNVAAPTGGKVVSLASANTAVATVAGAVTVPAGQTAATFTVTAGTVAANTTVAISATTNGSSMSANLTVTPPPAALSSVTLNPSSIYGAVTSTGTVTLTAAAPAGGAVVALASSNTTAATVPVSITVPAGATSATFTITGRALTTAATTTITTTYIGVSATATLTVNPAITVSTLTLNPTSVRGGTNSVATVTLSVAAPAGGVVVTMSSATTTVATVPATVTVLEGSRTATVTITTRTQTATRTSVISARVGTTTARTATLTVTR